MLSFGKKFLNVSDRGRVTRLIPGKLTATKAILVYLFGEDNRGDIKYSKTHPTKSVKLNYL